LESTTLIFRRASLEDFDAVHSIMREASVWLGSRGIDQWRWVDSPKGIAFLRRRIETCDVYLALVNDEAAGTLSIQWSDPETWGERGEDGLAAYVHGLAVRRSHAGMGLGAKMLDFAAGAARINGRKLLRLDCMPSNEKLREFYTERGFTCLGEQRSPVTALESALFERAI
jgi:GNAT superfamily N-acetyltransferase